MGARSAPSASRRPQPTGRVWRPLMQRTNVPVMAAIRPASRPGGQAGACSGQHTCRAESGPAARLSYRHAQLPGHKRGRYQLRVRAADACADVGLAVAATSGPARRRLRQVLPAAASVDGPVDATAAVSPQAFAEALSIAAAEQGVAALIAMVVQSASASLLPVLSAEEADGLLRCYGLPMVEFRRAASRRPDPCHPRRAGAAAARARRRSPARHPAARLPARRRPAPGRRTRSQPCDRPPGRRHRRGRPHPGDQEHLADPFLRRLPSDLRQPAGPGQDPDHVTSRGAREPLVRSGSLNVPGPNGRASRSRSDRSPVSMASREEPACRERSRTRVGPR